MTRSGLSNRSLLVLAVLVLLLCAAGGWRYWQVAGGVTPPPAVAAAGAQATGPAAVVAGTPTAGAKAPTVAAGAPSVAAAAMARPEAAMGVGSGSVPAFDVVRVGPKGDAVVAGRAAPGTEVVVFDGDREVARARTDQRGSFVALPAVPLAAGGRTLTLEAVPGGGAAAVRSEDSVVVVVPERGPGGAPAAGAKGEAVAVLVPKGAPARVLEAPGVRRGGVSLDVLDYDARGEIRFSGAAVPDGTVRVYVDNAAVGDARADAAGRWVLVPGAAVAAGVHALRIDQLDKGGAVVARIELPFERAAAPAGEAAGDRVVVQPGQSLWRLARSAYGQGVRYTVIFLANRDQIRDPARIYPGQAFALPAGRP